LNGQHYILDTERVVKDNKPVMMQNKASNRMYIICSSRHEVAFDTAWRDRFPDQALRVAAGIPRKHASGGRRLGGRYCQGCGAFPEM
jgi:hypothetical protein